MSLVSIINQELRRSTILSTIIQFANYNLINYYQSINSSLYILSCTIIAMQQYLSMLLQEVLPFPIIM